MSTADEESSQYDESKFDGFERQLPENCVEYLIFNIGPQADARKQLSQLEETRKSALQLAASLTKDYIWQKDEFNLELKNEQGLIYLHGLTDYSDAVEDEWLIVYLLRTLSKSHPHLWIRVFDTDGEFLLVEAANVLPKWLNPEIDHNRVWIHEGKLRTIPFMENDEVLSQRNLKLSDAVDIIKGGKQEALVHSTFIEAEAFYRLEKYPAQITESIHCSVVTIPRKLAYILHSSPKSVAPAIESFYLRDPIALKRILSPTSSLTFPPTDLVTVSVRFSKVLFAQLRSQRFEPPPQWQAAIAKTQKTPVGSKGLARLETGMKLTCGFEMLAPTAEKSKIRVVRELAIELQDLEEDGDAVLPSDEKIKTWKDSERDDSETWMDINYDDFERELDGKRTTSQSKDAGFGDTNTQSDLRKIVSRFEAFLNDETAGMEGAELDDMDVDDDSDPDSNDDDDSDLDSEAEDKEVSFDEEEFNRMMREMMGFAPVTTTSESTPNPTGKAKGKQPAQPEQDELSDDDDKAIQKLTSQLEAELNEHGALTLDPKETQARIKDKGKEKEKQAIDNDEDSDEEVDIDYNLAKNLLESFKSQAGMAGPTGNLLGLMGFQLPRDEDDEDTNEDEVGSSSQQIKGRKSKDMETKGFHIRKK